MKPLGVHLEAYWGLLLGFLGAFFSMPLGASWDFLGAEVSNYWFVLFPPLAPLGALLGLSCAVMVASWAVLEPSWAIVLGGGPLGGLLVGHLGRPLGPRGQSWSVGSSDRQARRTCTQRKNIITSWSPLGRPPGTLSGPRGGFMGHRLGAILGVVERSRRARRSARERPENLRCWGPDCRGMRGGGRGGGRRAREENPPPSGGLALLTGEP